MIVLWRRDIREKMNKSDNKYHENYTDALNNYETVKFTCSEEYQIKKFGDDIQG